MSHGIYKANYLAGYMDKCLPANELQLDVAFRAATICFCKMIWKLRKVEENLMDMHSRVKDHLEYLQQEHQDVQDRMLWTKGFGYDTEDILHLLSPIRS